MKYQSALLIPLMAFTLSACKYSGRKPVAPTEDSAPEIVAVKADEPKPEATATVAVEPETENFSMQLTVLNFLQGGAQPCEVKNKVFNFAKKDKAKKTVICKNSKVSVYMVSDAGTVKFAALDRKKGKDLPSSSSSFDTVYELGKERPMLRYSVENPYGFTYVMAEEVTGLDPKLLAEWNRLNDEATSLRASILATEQSGQTAPQWVKDQLEATLKEMAEISAEMEKARKK